MIVVSLFVPGNAPWISVLGFAISSYSALNLLLYFGNTSIQTFLLTYKTYSVTTLQAIAAFVALFSFNPIAIVQATSTYFYGEYLSAQLNV
jgi:hypothetical protein